jgi:hypothetical protein
MPSGLAIDFQSQNFSLTENTWLFCVLGCIPFVSLCRVYKGARVLEGCGRRNGFLFSGNKVSIAIMIRIRVF